MVTETIFSHPLAVTVIALLLVAGVGGRLFKISFRRIAKWYLYASVFAVLLVMNSIFFPFIGGKDYFFRFCVELALICTVLWWAFETRAGEVKQLIKTTFRKPIVIAVTVFAIIFLLACLFGYDASSAFWSNYERGEGGFQMIHYYLFFLLLAMLFQDEADWKNLFKCSLVAAGGMILYGIGGNLLIDKFIGPYAGGGAPAGWWHKLVDGRFQGTLGNPAYVAPYLIFSMFYTAYLWISGRLSGKTGKLMQWGYAVLIAVFLFFFVLAQTRGAFLGLAVGILALLVYFIIFGVRNVRKWSAVIFVVLIIAGIGLYSVRNTSFVQSIPAGRLLQISTKDATAQTRFWVWGEAWKGFLDRPILGWGPENFPAVFDKYFDPRFFTPGVATETWFDRAHSVFFDYLAETGLLGLLSYLGIFVAFYWQFGKKMHATHREGNGKLATNLERGFLFALPIAYLVQGLAIFDVFPMYISLFILLAFGSYYFTSGSNGPVKNNANR